MPNTGVTWRTILCLFALTCPSQAVAQLSSIATTTTPIATTTAPVSAPQPAQTVSPTSSITQITTTFLSKLDRPLRDRLYMPSGRSRVIIRALDAASVAPVALLVNDIGGTLGIQLPILNAQVADVPNA